MSTAGGTSSPRREKGERDSSVILPQESEPGEESATSSGDGPGIPEGDSGAALEGPVNNSNDDNDDDKRLEKHASNYKFVDFDHALGELEKDGDDENEGNGCRACYTNMWDNYPRCCALWMRVVFPMFILMALAFFGGWALARFEGPEEYAVNDGIMAARKVVRTINWNETADLLLALPITCLDNVLDDVELNDTEIIIKPTEDIVDFGTNISATITDLFAQFEIDGDTMISLQSLFALFRDLRELMQRCSDNAGLVAQLIQELSQSVGLQTAFSDPTFDWVRCWNETEFGE